MKTSVLRQHGIICVLLLALCAAVYATAIDSQFMIDDFGYVDPGKISSQYTSWGKFFTIPRSHHYNPLDVLINVTLFRLLPGPEAFRLINIVLCALAGFGVYVLFSQLSANRRAALIAAALFCMHPLTAENIYHSTFVPVFIQQILLLAGLSLMWRYTDDRRPVFYIAALLLYGTALLILEFSLIYPFVVLYMLRIVRGWDWRRTWRSVWPLLCVTGLYLAVWFVMTAPSVDPWQRFARSGSGMSLAGWAGYGRAVAWYLRNFVFPADVVFMKNFPLTAAELSWATLALSLGLIAAAAGLCRMLRRDPRALFAALWVMTGFAVAALPAMGRPGMGIIFEPYWMLFSSTGLFWLTGQAVDRMRAALGRTACLIVLISVLAYIATFTVGYNLIARRERLYAEHWLRSSPGNRIPAMILASLYTYGHDPSVPQAFIDDLLAVADRYIARGADGLARDLLRVLLNNAPPSRRPDIQARLAFLDRRRPPASRE